MTVRVVSQLRLAVSVGLVGGFVLGCREALLAVQDNAVVQPGDYLLVYFAVPVLSWVALAPLVLTPVALTLSLRRAPAGVHVVWVYAAVLAFVGALSVVQPRVDAIASLLQSVGMTTGLGTRVILWAAVVAVAGACAVVVGAATASYAARMTAALRFTTRAVAAVSLLLVLPVARFLATDWKWSVQVAPAAMLPAEEPNVLLISVDTLRADYLGCYGSRDGLTPNLDRLAEEGTLFQQAMTSSPWTLPSMASVLTALYPHHHGAGRITNGRTPLGRSALPSGTWALSTALHEHGYRTHAIVTNPYLALRYGLGEGFESYENITIESEGFLAFGETTAVRLLRWVAPDVIIGDRGTTVSQRASRWIEHSDPNRPFFLWLHYIDPHPPYSRPGATRHKSMRGDLAFGRSADSADGFMLTSPDVARLRSGEIRLTDGDKESVRDLYRNEVQALDVAVGEVLEALDRRGLRGRTVVVFVSDHGEEFWEHGGVEHGHTVYEELVWVPLLMRWPDHLPAGVRVQRLVRSIDIAPTVLDLLAIGVPPNLDGISLVPVLRGEEADPRIAVIENMLFAEERVGVRTESHKYVRWAYGKEELYDLRRDPGEGRDLAGSEVKLASMRELYAGLALAAGRTSTGAPAPMLDGGAREALRALGYTH